MRVLVISQEVWRDDTNGGNVLSNIFDGLDAEFAQIYCSAGTPSNHICKKYYQMTDAMVIRNVTKKEIMGNIITFPDYPVNIKKSPESERENKRFYSFFRRHSYPIFHAAKEFLWKISGWENTELIRFIEEFNPDIIFAPCYASHIMLSIDRFAAELTQKPVISYISDDSYSLKQFSLSPIYWINKFVLRRNLRKTFPYYQLTYTMTDEQLIECQNAFHCNMKILRKGTDISQVPHKISVNSPIRLIYAGGIYCGRWKTLTAIVHVLQKINKNGVKIALEIYTGNELSSSQKLILNDGVNSYVHGVINQKELKEKYRQSDIALHVESFDLKNKLLTRLSFSTKIVDCLASGCAVMAICWENHSGYVYLKKENAAICIANKSDIYDRILHLINNSSEIIIYAEKAHDCCVKNHKTADIQNAIIYDFQNIQRGQK